MYQVLDTVMMFDDHKRQLFISQNRLRWAKSTLLGFPAASLTFCLESSFKLIQKSLCHFVWVNPVKFRDILAIIGYHRVPVTISCSSFFCIPGLCSGRDRAAHPVGLLSWVPRWCCSPGCGGWGLSTHCPALVCLGALMPGCFRGMLPCVHPRCPPTRRQSTHGDGAASSLSSSRPFAGCTLQLCWSQGPRFLLFHSEALGILG